MIVSWNYERLVGVNRKKSNYNTIIKKNKTKPKYGQDDPHSISLVGSLFKDLRLTWPA